MCCTVLTAQVGWFGVRVGSHPTLSLHSLNEPGVFLQQLTAAKTAECVSVCLCVWIFTLDGSNDADSRKNVSFWGVLILLSI